MTRLVIVRMPPSSHPFCIIFVYFAFINKVLTFIIIIIINNINKTPQRVQNITCSHFFFFSEDFFKKAPLIIEDKKNFYYVSRFGLL